MISKFELQRITREKKFGPTEPLVLTADLERFISSVESGMMVKARQGIGGIVVPIPSKLAIPENFTKLLRYFESFATSIRDIPDNPQLHVEWET